MDDSSRIQKNYWISSLVTIAFIFLLVSVFLYFFVFSRSEQLTEYSATPIPTPVPQQGEQVLGMADAADSLQWKVFEATESAVQFMYPETFSIKEENWECVLCPNVVLENGDERILVGTIVTPIEVSSCEAVVEESQQDVAGLLVMVQKYDVVTDTDECLQQGISLSGVRATFLHEQISYYVDYLFENTKKAEAQVLFSQLLSSLRVTDNTTP